MEVNIPVSLGELLDKISILEIKSKKISNDSKLTNIKKELNGLKKVLEDLNFNFSETNNLYEELYKINLTLWEIEDSIRILEKDKNFDNEFIELARKVYFTNDKRFEIKSEINKHFGSEFFEEKQYVEYE